MLVGVYLDPRRLLPLQNLEKVGIMKLLAAIINPAPGPN